MFRCWNRWITYILMYMNCNFCRDDVYIVPTSEWEIFPSLGGCPQGGGFVPLG